MNSNAAPDSPKSLVPKRVVAYVLLAMFALTALASVTNYFPSTDCLLFFFWTMAMLVIASYWMRIVLDEHDYLDDATSKSLRPNPFSNGFLLTPFLMMRP